MRSHRGGFTLIELLIVIVVIGILAAIVVPKLNVTKRRAYRSTMIADLKNVSSMQEVYHGNHVAYGASPVDLGFNASEGVTITINEADANGWSATAGHAGVSTGQCGIYLGDAAQSGGAPSTTPGVVECDF